MAAAPVSADPGAGQILPDGLDQMRVFSFF